MSERRHRGSVTVFALVLFAVALGCAREGAEETTPRGTPLGAGVTPRETSAEPGDDGSGLPGRSRPPSGRERLVIQQLMRAAEGVRGLRFVREVQTRVQDEERIRAFVQSGIEEDELAEARDLYVSLGLLPADVDLESLLLDVMGEQILGYYDPDEATLVVRDSVIEGLAQNTADEARVILVHELVHALQDQHLALGERHDEERDSDAENAYRAVVEGDATLAMMGYALRSQGVPLSRLTSDPALLERFFGSGASTNGDELANAPAILRVTLVAAYLAGGRFCAGLYEHGQWAAVDQAHRRAPTSMEQVLHPERYWSGHGPLEVSVPPHPELDALGYERVQEDTLGELEIAVYLARDHGGERHPAAEGWGGDRIALYTHADRAPIAIWYTLWDTREDAGEADFANRGAPGHAHRVDHGVLFAHGLPEELEGVIDARFAEYVAAQPPAGPRLPSGP